MRRIILAALLCLLPALASAFTFDCLPNVNNNGETGTNLRWHIVKGAPSWIKWNCPNGKTDFVAVDYWPLDFVATVGAANALGWPAIKALALWLPDAATVAPTAEAQAQAAP